MTLDIVVYGHPALRARGRRVDAITTTIRTLATDMIETMREADGVGLAAQQVGMPLQMFVLEIEQAKDRPSEMRIDGKPADFESLMPLTLLNAEVAPYGEEEITTEGCLSFPGMRGEVGRPESVRVKAQTLDGKTIEFEADGLLARAIQHEHDHNQGVLFIDRMTPMERKRLADEIRSYQHESSQ